MPIRWARLAMAGLWMVGSGAIAFAAEPLDGRAIYQHYCEACHGVTGRGDGPDASLMVTRPRDLRSGFLARYSTDDLVRRIRSGVPLTLALDLTALRARAGEVEALAAYLQRLPTIDWRRVEEGQAAYAEHCELCHGRAGRSEWTMPEGARAPRDLGDPAFQRSVSDDEIADVVLHGRRGMPAVRTVSSDLPALIAYVRLLSPGYELYDRYCAACHGDDGRGGGNVDDPTQPTTAFDRAYFRRRDPEQVRAAVWHMLATERPAMPHFRRVLGEDEVRAVIRYLRATE